MQGQRRHRRELVGQPDPLGYRQVVAKIRALVGLLVPSDATVAVVSRGDDRLVNLGGRRGWHFPATDEGEYAGHHPADSEEATAELERLRAKGAEFLVVPRPALWWLDYYEGFRQHLEGRYRVVMRDAESCVIFALERPTASDESRGTPASWDEASTTILSCLGKEGYGDRIAMLLTKILPHYVKPAIHRRYFRLWEEHGCHVTPVSYYQPIPDTRELPEELWTRESELVGIDLNAEFQLHLLRNVFPRFRPEYDQFSSRRGEGSREFHLGNGVFDGTDALVLYCMIRHFRPKVVIEVGSGHSSRISAEAAVRNGHTRLVCIEPNPCDELVEGFPGLSALVAKRVQDVELGFFGQLGSGDMLFIDSSHVVRCGSDVNYLLLEVLPRLSPGVLVHVHDIFLPGEYRRDWIMEEFRFWNEQYLLQAFLTFNSEYEVILSNSYLGREHGDEMRATFPMSPWWGGGSFWIRRKA